MGFLIWFYESSYNACFSDTLRRRVWIYWFNFQQIRSCNYEMYYWESIISNRQLCSTDVGRKGAKISLICRPDNPLLIWVAAAKASKIVAAAAGVCGLFTSCELQQRLLLNSAGRWMEFMSGKLRFRRLSPGWNPVEDWSLCLFTPWEDYL